MDKLTYASNLKALASVSQSERYQFIQADIIDQTKLQQIFQDYQPDWVIHFAAESHVDRSINAAQIFIQTNILGTYHLLEVARQYWQNLSLQRKNYFRFHHISTDEVYGDLAFNQTKFNELSAYNPSSPYSVSKACGDHLVRAWGRTYDFPFIISCCTNNYGEFQHSEKLIPLTILNALQGKPLPIYGNGQQIRDWLFVDDHVRALYLILTQGKIGQTYNIAGNNPKTNIAVVQAICELLEEFLPNKPTNIQSYQQLITYVKDRPGHDICYGIDCSQLSQQLGWQPQESFQSGLRKTVIWYLQHYSIRC